MHILVHQCLLFCGCFFNSGCVSFGPVDLETLANIYAVVQDIGEEKPPCVHSAVLPRPVAYLSGSQSVIYGAAYTQ